MLDKSYDIKDKMKSIIISDSSSLIDFCNITNGLELLKKCFNPVFVPQGVYDEIIYKEQKEKIDKNKDFIKVLKDYNDIEKNAIKELIDNGLHKGESEAIALAENRFKAEQVEILLQDTDARDVCDLKNIDYTGSLGVVIYAHKEKYISEKFANTKIDEIAKTNPYINRNTKLIKVAKKQIAEQQECFNLKKIAKSEKDKGVEK